MTAVTQTLPAWLLDQIAEDEAKAREAHYDGQAWVPEEEAVVAVDRDLDPVLFLDRKCDARHAANWDPARVLAECEAKRRIVELRESAQGQAERAGDDPTDPVSIVLRSQVIAFDAALSTLALPYADREGWREDWRP